MAEYIDEQHKQQIQLEKELVEKLGNQYDDLIAFFILIAFDERMSKRDKIKAVSLKVSKYKDFNISFSESAIENSYMLGKNLAYKDINKPIKKITNAQRKEMKSFIDQLRVDLDSRLGVYEKNANKLILKVDLAKLREESLGFKKATEQRYLDRRRKTKEVLFLDSKGRRISNKAIMSVGPGDIIWDSMASAKRSTYLNYGITKVLHISVIDDRTTDLCLSLHETVRDLTKDRIPPMHIRCRSDVRALDPSTGELFQ